MKKILLLGGSHGQLPAIYEAKKRGLYTILCDYLPDNPGIGLVDAFFQVSTTDSTAVLEIARANRIDYVMAYASDPAALTAAFVAEKMGLPGSGFEGVRLLAYKDLFRQFQREHGFNAPEFEVYETGRLAEITSTKVPFPLQVKPVDSSDTKGVSLVHDGGDLLLAAREAITYSRAGRVIAEEFVDARTANFHGDGFALDGKLVFSMLGDQLMTSPAHPLKPTGSIYPSRKPDSLIAAAVSELEKLISLSGYRNGGVNLEVRINGRGEVYVMEIGPRSGGTLTPQAIRYASGFDMLAAHFDFFLGQDIHIPRKASLSVICYVVHAQKDGVLKEIQKVEELERFLEIGRASCRERVYPRV